MPKNETVSLYGVARNEAIIGELYPDVETAKSHLQWVEGTMRDLGLESDVRLVTVERTVSHSRPHVYREPEEEIPEDEDDEPAVEQATD